MKYAILDIETTGLSPAREKITEIAIYYFLQQNRQTHLCHALRYFS